MFLLFQGKPGLPGPVGLHGVPGLPGPRGEKVGYFPNPSAQGESERNIRVDLWEGILGSADIPGVYWHCSEPNVSRGNFSPPALLRKTLEQKSGKDGCSGIRIPEDAVLSLQGMAGIGIPGTAGEKGEEGEQVGWEFRSEICIKILLECSLAPNSPPIFRFSLESCGSRWKGREKGRFGV